jgi:antirestriction protein ArdC
MLLRYFNVFNAEQATWPDGAPEFGNPKANDLQVNSTCEGIVQGYLDGGPKLCFGGDRAYYAPTHDYVQVPDLDTFETAEQFYSTVFHELTHSTGHPSRLARVGIMENHRFGDESYSKEELIAEMGAAMLCGVAGIDQVTIPMQASYIGNWVRTLQGDHKLVIQAAAGAQRAADRILGVEFANTEQEAA